MRPKWPKLASLAQKIFTLWFQFFGAVFALQGYPFKNIFIIEYIKSYLTKRNFPIVLASNNSKNIYLYIFDYRHSCPVAH